MSPAGISQLPQIPVSGPRVTCHGQHVEQLLGQLAISGERCCGLLSTPGGVVRRPRGLGAYRAFQTTGMIARRLGRSLARSTFQPVAGDAGRAAAEAGGDAGGGEGSAASPSRPDGPRRDSCGAALAISFIGSPQRINSFWTSFWIAVP